MIFQVVFFVVVLQISSSLSCSDSAFRDRLIVSGKTIKRGQWPFTAAVVDAQNLEYLCGATAITRIHFITSAHCIQPKRSHKPLKPSDIVIHYGAFNISDRYEEESILLNVEGITVHPDWKKYAANYDADLAILEVTETDGTTIKFSCWSSYDDSLEGEGVVVGWRFSNEKNLRDVNGVAKVAALNAISNEDCFLGHFGSIARSSNRTFCAEGEGEFFLFFYKT